MADLTPEQRARQQIDAQLVACGWVVQDYKQFNPSAGRGIALREAPLKSGTCDYLLLVDRKAVGVTEAKKQGTLLSGVAEQAMAEFQQFVAPDTGRKFTEVYNVQHLTSNKLDSVARVTICTIQRLYSILRGEELDEDLEEKSGFEIAAALSSFAASSGHESAPSSSSGSADQSRLTSAATKPLEVAYTDRVPIEAFDFIVTDECHRSIYGLWRQVLEYFDAFLIGLTATPSKQTIGFFNQNLVMEYNHERAVADGVNVGYEVYRIKTQVTEQGGKVEKGFYVDRRSKETRAVRWERLDEDLA
jgi:type I restriction enzyme R subunit